MVSGRIKVQDIVMGKGLQIALVALLYILCAAGGYFLHDVVMASAMVEETVASEEQQVVPNEEPVVSAVPMISEISAPKRQSTGKYNFSVSASVPTSDELIYFVYSDVECLTEVAKTLDGNFMNIPAVASQTYYVRVQNLSTKDLSEVSSVSGFVPLTMYEKITKAEIEKICNSGDFGTAPDKFNLRIAKGCQIIPQGIKDGERGVSTVADVCQKIMMGIWQSVTAESIEYDSQNRMKKLVLRVNY